MNLMHVWAIDTLAFLNFITCQYFTLHPSIENILKFKTKKACRILEVTLLMFNFNSKKPM